MYKNGDFEFGSRSKQLIVVFKRVECHFDVSNHFNYYVKESTNVSDDRATQAPTKNRFTQLHFRVYAQFVIFFKILSF